MSAHHGDCLAWLPTLPEASVDAVVTDPPYALSFMGAEWDSHPSASAYQAWCEQWARECLRVLKPGGHLLAFGGTRTAHRLTVGIENSGFEVRDSIAWLYGSGFPKHASALKPAHEPIVVARKPLAGTVAANVLAHGTGALNIDATRVGAGPSPSIERREQAYSGHPGEPGFVDRCSPERFAEQRAGERLGRWPANVTLVHGEGCEPAGVRKVRGTNPPRLERSNARGVYGEYDGATQTDHYADPDGTETVPVWTCEPGCPVAELDRQSGERSHAPHRGGRQCPDTWPYGIGGVSTEYDDRGGASRFYYTAKASRAERVTVNGVNHPTVKPLALIRWLVRLVTPPGGIVLDPFLGSGTTAEAAILEGFEWLGCEQQPEYLPLIAARVKRGREATRQQRIPEVAS